MAEHSLELLHLAIWVIIGFGGLGLSLVGWGGKKVLERMDKQDHALDTIADLLESEIKKLRELHYGMEVRVARIETTCNLMHNTGVKFGRRKGDVIADPVDITGSHSE